MVLYMGYDNGPSDGGGAQLHRILVIYCICRGFNIKYVHLPITHIGYKGLAHLMANREDDPEVERQFNGVLQVNAHCHPVPEGVKVIIPEKELDPPMLKGFIEQGEKEDIFVKVTLCRYVIETSPDLYRFAKELAPPVLKLFRPKRDHLDVHMHLRRGELYAVDSWRMIPNEYYVKLIEFFNQVLPRFTRHHTIHVHTEVPTKDITVTSTHHGIMGRIKEDIILKAADLKLEEFNLPNVALCINDKPWDTLRAFQKADILVMAHSSFSIVGASLNSEGVILYHPFWHRPMSNWIDPTQPTFIPLFQKEMSRLLGI